MQRPTIYKAVNVIFFLFLIFTGLFFAKPFLVPLCFAGLFAMLFLPLARKFERKGISRGFATLFCLLILIAVLAGIIALVTWQVNDLVSDLGNVQQKAQKMMDQVKDYVSRTFGMAPAEQEKIIEEQAKNSNGAITGIGSSIFGFVVDFILMLVYIFLFLHARSHIKKFILKIIPSQNTGTAEHAMTNIQKVTQQYLTGLSMMIVCLWILYSIGFSIVGLKNAFFFAILCGLLETIPFVGNLTGNSLAVLMAVTQGGGMSMIIGILVSYAIIQFFQTYILEPLVVGAEVNVNPLFTILALVIGELIWGIPGMVLAIPLLAIVKIICDHIDSLKPYGFLIGSEKKKKGGLLARFKKSKS